MNIYWCNEFDMIEGLYVVARTRGKAKMLFAHELDCNYTDVRSSVRRKDVPEEIEGVIYDEDSTLLKKYNLEYTPDVCGDNQLPYCY